MTTGQRRPVPQIMRDISPQLYVALGDNMTEERLSSVSEMMNQTRRFYRLEFINYEAMHNRRLYQCYFITVIYRNALSDMDRYFSVRDMYVGNLEYEMGYLTHEVILHYQMILEIYDIVHRRYVKNRDKNYAPVNYIFFMYLNILEQSKVVIHLCNMMHELEAKYKAIKPTGVFTDFEQDSEKKSSIMSKNNETISENEKKQAEYEKWLEIKKKEQRKKIREQNKYYKELQKIGLTVKTTKRHKKQWTNKWPLDYGWSIENW